jgi:hypothetical protein
MGKQRGSGAKAAADCALVHMARERGRRFASCGRGHAKLAAQQQVWGESCPGGRRVHVRRWCFHHADAVGKLMGAPHGVCTFLFTFAPAGTARVSTAQRVGEVWARCICLLCMILTLDTCRFFVCADLGGVGSRWSRRYLREVRVFVAGERAGGVQGAAVW